MENQRTGLYLLIVNSKKGDKDSLEQLCLKFEPLLKRYAYLLQDEDGYQSLILTLINCVNSMPIEQKNFNLDNYILSYIKSSIVNSYMQLDMSLNKYNRNTCFIIDDSVDNGNAFDIPVSNETEINEFILFYDLRKLLNEKELMITKLKCRGYRDADIAKIMNVTRQAINKQIHKLRIKLGTYFFSDN